MLKKLLSGLFKSEFEKIQTEHQTQLQSIQNDAEDAKKQLLVLNDAKNVLEKNIEKTKQENENLNQTIQELKKQLSESENKSNQLENNYFPIIQRLELEKADLEKQVTEKDDQTLSKAHSDQALLSEAQSQIQQLKEEVQSHRQQKEFIQNQLRQIESEKNEKIQSLSLKIQELEKELEKVQAVPTPSLPTSKQGTPIREQKMVLIVDDALTTRILQKNMLESAGFQVIMGKDGIEGKNLCQENQPDLIITDVEMPKMDGFELTRWIKQSTFRDIPVLMVTSHADPEFQQKGREAGADDFIEKTNFNQKTFVEIVNRHL